MKAKKIIVLSGLVFCLLSLSSFKSIEASNIVTTDMLEQEGLIVYAKYDGNEDSGYKFVVKDRNGNEQVLTFQTVDAAVLKSYDLNSEALVGTMFKVTFNKNIGLASGEVNTITNLKKL